MDRLAQSLMPANLKPLRQMLHATAVEVLLYLTPLHCQDMLDSVVLSLNTVHAKFMQRNPGFDVRRCSAARPCLLPNRSVTFVPSGTVILESLHVIAI